MEGCSWRHLFAHGNIFWAPASCQALCQVPGARNTAVSGRCARWSQDGFPAWGDRVATRRPRGGLACLTVTSRLCVCTFRGFVKLPDTFTDDSSTTGFWARRSALHLWDFNSSFLSFSLPLAICFLNLYSFCICPLGIPAGHRGAQPGGRRRGPVDHHAQKPIPTSQVLRLFPAQGAAEVLLCFLSCKEVLLTSYMVKTGLLSAS